VDKVTTVLFIGIGGQGVLKASDVLARAAFLAGLDVKKTEIHGMSQRGGGVTSAVRFGKKVYSPLAPSRAVDFLVCFDRAEGEKYLGQLSPGGRPFFLDGDLLSRLGDPRAANVALLGRLAKMLDIPLPTWEKAISYEIPEKYVALNLDAFRIANQS
jgi:indolepyruvate ferredoxin oxidoreductase beta subunit